MIQTRSSIKAPKDWNKFDIKPGTSLKNCSASGDRRTRNGRLRRALRAYLVPKAVEKD